MIKYRFIWRIYRYMHDCPCFSSNNVWPWRYCYMKKKLRYSLQLSYVITACKWASRELLVITLWESTRLINTVRISTSWNESSFFQISFTNTLNKIRSRSRCTWYSRLQYNFESHWRWYFKTMFFIVVLFTKKTCLIFEKNKLDNVFILLRTE